VRIPIKATAHEPIEQAGYIFEISTLYGLAPREDEAKTAIGAAEDPFRTRRRSWQRREISPRSVAPLGDRAGAAADDPWHAAPASLAAPCRVRDGRGAASRIVM
jgi:hypothetical protein